MSTGNLKQWIEEAAEGEPIEAVVIGEASSNVMDRIPDYEQQPKEKVLSWDEAQRWLDYDFDSGYGTANCNSVFAWTKSRIIFVDTYDGATTPCWIPRNPIDCGPFMPGGG